MTVSLYERVASHMVGTALQRPAEWLRRAKDAGFRRRHPELAEVFHEDERIERTMRGAIGVTTNCIDIGCHLGAYLHRIVTLAPRGRHLAVEPVPHKAQWLRRKFPEVAVLEAALDESEGVRDFFVDPAQTSLSRLGSVTGSSGRRMLQVRCRRLDDVVDETTPIGFVKVDVNGGELYALRGGRRLLARDRPFILLGCTQRGLDDHRVEADEVFEFFVAEAGYRIFLLKDHLGGGEPLDAAAFRTSMVYPFQALNYAIVPAAAV